MTRPRRLQILPGFGLSLGMSLLFVALILLLPLSGLALNLAQLTLADYWNIVSDGQTLAALRVTFWAAAWASLFNALFGLLLAWVLTRYRFPGRVFVDALVDLPFALPTAVAGIALATLFAKDGWLGQPLAALGIAIAYKPAGIVVAMIFTSIPFVVRAVQPVLEALPPAVEEAAATGANLYPRHPAAAHARACLRRGAVVRAQPRRIRRGHLYRRQPALHQQSRVAAYLRAPARV